MGKDNLRKVTGIKSMDAIKFTIKGNQENPQGNPVPYVRATKGALWRKDTMRYARWKEFVQASFLKCPAAKKVASLSSKKPIVSMDKARMDIRIEWANGSHGDPDNIWKGIADALFMNDKNVDGSFVSQISGKKCGQVEIEIIF
jgi:Holliday junction resolvase RusA-like endonuclease